MALGKFPGMASDSASSSRLYAGLTRTERDAERRQKLLDAGLDAFGTSGYSSASVESLCSAAGVSTRNFYDHFASREDLLIAIFDEGVGLAQTATLEALAALPPGAGVREMAQAGLEAFVTAMLQDERRARINFVEVVGASRAVEAHRRTALRAFSEIFFGIAEALASQGLIVPRPRYLYRVAATALVGAVVEALLEWMSQDDKQMPLEHVIEGLVEIMVILSEASSAPPVELQPVFERALEVGVDRVQAVERERLVGLKRPGRRGLRTMVGQDAVAQREPALVGELRGAVGREELHGELEVADEAALFGQADRGAVGELARLAEVVDDRGGHEQVTV